MGSLHAHLSRFHPIFEAQDLGNLKPGTTEKKTGDIPETGDISKEGHGLGSSLNTDEVPTV